MDKTGQSALNTLRDESKRALAEVLGGATEVAVLDFPAHMNVGDSMIWAGEMSYLRQIGVRVRYIADIDRFSRRALTDALPEGPILLHGGGNFGDVWPRFQCFREEIIEAFPDRRIIQLPQTLYYEREFSAARTNKIMGAHRNFTLLLRDHTSMARAQRLLPAVVATFVPDMALGWTPKVQLSDGSRGLLVLARQDHEAQSDLEAVERELAASMPVEFADWGLRGRDFARWKALRLPGRMVRKLPAVRRSSLTEPILRRANEAMLQLNLEAGLKLYRNRQVVVTNRLHAHILAVLMGIPHVVLDNSYGKVRSIYDDYTGVLGQSLFATTEAEAVGMVRQLSD